MNVAYLACGGWVAASIGAAAELGLADLLADGPKSTAELARATGTDARALERVLRVLAGVSVFAEVEGRFVNTADSERLRAGHPGSLRHFCRLAAGMYQQAFGDLMHTLHTGEPASRKTFGGSIYEYMNRTPEAALVYDLAMEELAQPVGARLADAYDFSAVRLVVDVGGGRGTMLRPLLSRFPQMRGICVDRAAVADRAAEAWRCAAPELASRIDFVPGDFFSALPPGADVYLLKNVLHNWGDDDARRILGGVRTAMAGHAGARLLVIEPLKGSAMPDAYMRLDDLLQVVVSEPGATARDAGALRTLVEQSGLRVLSMDGVAAGRTIVEAAAAAEYLAT